MQENLALQLNEAQRKIFNINSGKHIVQAPAGCGKTEVLTLRVIDALSRGEDPSKMICLTFTNRAAREMRERLSIDNKEIFIGNLHRYCERFLQLNGLVPGNTSLLDEVEYKYVLNGLIKKYGDFQDFQRHRIFHYIAERKREVLDLGNMRNSYKAGLNALNLDAMEQIFLAYEKLKTAYLMTDFDDLLALTIYHLRRNQADNLDYKMTNYHWLQVDESQDLNPAQWEIIRLIAPNYRCAVLFGDAEQSIFSFLGSDQNAFVKLLSKSDNVHFLDENFRSKNNPDIIAMLNTYLQKTLLSTVQFQESKFVDINPKHNFQFIQVSGEPENETSYIATKILPELDTTTETTAIIVRANQRAEEISEELLQRQIPHFRVSGKDFFETDEIKQLKAFLQTIIAPFDLLSWSRVVRQFSNNKSLENARKEVFELYQNGLTPHDILLGETSMSERLFHHYQHGRIIVFDTETTGLDTDEADIIQIAAIELVDGKFSREFEVYILTDEEKLSATVDVHHIDFQTLQSKGVSPQEGLDKFREFVGEDAILLAHNLDYDRSMLYSFYRRNDVELPDLSESATVDSLTVARLLYPKQRKHTLENLIETLGLEGVNSHNALDDVRATVNLVHRLAVDISPKMEIMETNRKRHTLQWKTFIQRFEPVYRESRKKYVLDTKLSRFLEVYAEQFFAQHIQEDKRWLAWMKIIRAYEQDYRMRSLRTHLLEKMREFSSFKEVDLIDDSVKIVVTTAHKAKGLSFDNVILCEAVNGIYPHFASTQEEQIQEEKRVLYVALSRAKKRIFITTHSKFTTSFGTEKVRETSPFLADILPYFNQNNWTV